MDIFIIIKIAIVLLAFLSIYLLFSKEGELAKSELIFSFITIYILITSYVNYNLLGSELYLNKAFVLMLALFSILGNFIKKRSFIAARIFVNIAIFMNLYFLFK